MTQDGRCVCPRGTSLVRGRCRKDAPPQCKLLPGQIRTEDGRCVCPRGTRLIRGECRKPQTEQCTLLPGQIRLDNGRCVCPRGTSLIRGACRKDPPPDRCPRGYMGTPPNCKRLQINPDLQRLIEPTQRTKAADPVGAAALDEDRRLRRRGFHLQDDRRQRAEKTRFPSIHTPATSSFADSATMLAAAPLAKLPSRPAWPIPSTSAG